MKFVLAALLGLCLGSCGVKTDLITYEKWQADEAKAESDKVAAEKAKDEAAAQAAEPKPAPKPERPAHKKGKRRS